MKKNENLISTILIFLYIIVFVSSEILLAKFIGIYAEPIGCNIEFKQILVYSLIGLFKILDKIVVAIWIFLHAKNYFKNSHFYALIGLIFGWIGLAFYASELLIEKKSLPDKESNKFAILLIVVFFISFIFNYLYSIAEFQTTNILFGKDSLACIYASRSKNYRIYTTIIVFVKFLVYIFIALKFSKFLKTFKVKTTLWIIPTLLIGIFPWLIMNIVKVIKENKYNP